LLKLIVSTIPKVPHVAGEYVVMFEGEEIRLPHITPAVLYHLYTQDELRREEEERGSMRRLLSRVKKTEFICALAHMMHERGVLALEGDDFQDIVRQQLTTSAAEPEALASEVRSCSFLQRDHRDCLRFTHKSFMEYYAALYLC
jgi:hypothetical protein